MQPTTLWDVLGQIFRPEKFVAPLILCAILVVVGIVWAALQRRQIRRMIDDARP